MQRCRRADEHLRPVARGAGEAVVDSDVIGGGDAGRGGMWISPRQRRRAVLLTNKLYYTRDRQPLTDIRNTFHGLACD